MYAMVGTRPDLAYAVGILAQHMQEPRRHHWQAAQRVLRYIQSTKDLHLTFQAGAGHQGDQLTGYCDADWAGDEETRKSTSGYFFTLAGGQCEESCHRVVIQGGNIQFLSLSSVESEYVAASQCVAEGIWLTRLANEMGLYNPEPLIIYSDSTGATNLA